MKIIYSISNIIEKNVFIKTSCKIAVILLVTFIVIKVLVKIFNKSKLTEKIQGHFLKNIIVGVTWILGAIIALYQIPGMDSAAKTLLAGSGIIAAVLSFGAKETFGNIVSGLMIVTAKPFEIGDRVIIADSNKDIVGTVEEITLRHTVIRTYANTAYILSNSSLDKLGIENTTKFSNSSGNKRVLEVVISSESDLRKALKIIENIVGSHELYYDNRTESEIKEGEPKVIVRVAKFTDRGIQINLTVKTKSIDDNFKACSDILLSIKEAFNKDGIELPYYMVDIKED